MKHIVEAARLRVYRVQDGEGRGPFRPGVSRFWAEPRPDHDKLLPWVVEFGLDAASRATSSLGAHLGCGCRTREQLRRWFTASECAKLQVLGYRAVSLCADRILRESSTQLLFQRVKPLSMDVTFVHLHADDKQGKGNHG